MYYCWKSNPALMVVQQGKGVVLESVVCFNSLPSFRHLYPRGWRECPREVSWHWCAHWGWCCNNRGCASHLVCWLSQGDLPHRADLWPQLMMPLLCLSHPPLHTALQGCRCLELAVVVKWWRAWTVDGCFQGWVWEGECKRLGYWGMKKQSNLFCVHFASDLISADAELL